MTCARMWSCPVGKASLSVLWQVVFFGQGAPVRLGERKHVRLEPRAPPRMPAPEPPEKRFGVAIIAGPKRAVVAGMSSHQKPSLLSNGLTVQAWPGGCQRLESRRGTSPLSGPQREIGCAGPIPFRSRGPNRAVGFLDRSGGARRTDSLRSRQATGPAHRFRDTSSPALRCEAVRPGSDVVRFAHS
jgi:hypothetical protein